MEKEEEIQKAECTFSDAERLFGDIPRLRKPEADAEETIMKIPLLNE